MTLQQALGLLLLLAMMAAGIWGYIHLLRLSHDPAKILFKTALTAVVIVVAGVTIAPMMRAGGYIAAFGGVPAGAVTGVIVAIIWREHIANLVARPFENLFTGGNQPPDPQAFYSVARAKRQHQLFDEAIEEIRDQLERFPDDFEGLMLLAEIQAVNQKNLSGAADTIGGIARAHHNHPGRVAAGLTALADWQLQIGRDRNAALEAFERIQALFPDHPVALEAGQRIAHLPTQEMLDRKSEPRVIALKEQPKVLIRDPSEVKVELKEESPDEAIGRLTNHLEIHPQDRAAREELAGHYANHLHDARLAVEQLELLIRQPGHDKHHVMKWLNLAADYHLHLAGDLEAARTALERIERCYPGSPAAEQAMRRKMLLGRELKAKEKSRDITLGSYKKDLGLR